MYNAFTRTTSIRVPPIVYAYINRADIPLPQAVFTDWAGNFSKPSHLGPTKGHNYEDYDYYIPLDGDYHDYEGGHKLGPGG